MGKDDLRIIVLGDVDEASSFLGLARAEAEEEIGGMLISCSASSTASWATWRCPRRTTRSARRTCEFLDDALEEWRWPNGDTQRVRHPRGEPAGALLDVARSVVRRAERSLVAAGYAGEHPYAVRVVNRLSDLLFVLARNADGKRPSRRGSRAPRAGGSRTALQVSVARGGGRNRLAFCHRNTRGNDYGG